MKRILILLAVLLVSSPALANVEEGYNPGEPRVVTSWYGVSAPAAAAADLRFISGMRPHHAGALTMSNEYLTDKESQNYALRQLARGIIRNQEFEIKMLDTVESYVRRAAPEGRGMKQVAEYDLVQRERFFRAPMPGFLDVIRMPTSVSYRDVQFAKAMIIHHQAALDMAKAYLSDAEAKNGYLRLMCLDILVDQQQEIDFMQAVIGRYSGNPDDVRIDASMIHGMEGMSHHQGHGLAPAKKKATEGHGGHQHSIH